MSSINFTAGNHLTSGNDLPSPTGDFTVGGWFKFGTANYTSGFPTVLSWDNVGAQQYLYVQTEGGSGITTVMAAGVTNTGALQEVQPLYRV